MCRQAHAYPRTLRTQCSPRGGACFAVQFTINTHPSPRCSPVCRGDRDEPTHRPSQHPAKSRQTQPPDQRKRQKAAAIWPQNGTTMKHAKNMEQPAETPTYTRKHAGQTMFMHRGGVGRGPRPAQSGDAYAQPPLFSPAIFRPEEFYAGRVSCLVGAIIPSYEQT